MTLLNLSPWQLAGILAAGSAVITVLYLLRVRPRPAEVPFEPLWRAVLAAERRTNPLRQLRRLLSLLFQAAILSLLALALANPRLGGAPAARHLVIVIDASASMQAAEGGVGRSRPMTTSRRSRFGQAVQAARREVERLASGGTALLVAAEAAPRVVCPRTGDSRVLEEALDRLTPADSGADLDAALRLAAEAARGNHDGRILLLTDVSAPPLGNLPLGLAPEALEVRRFGAPGPNVALTAFDARLSVADPLRAEVYVQVESFVEAPQGGTLRLYAGASKSPFRVVPFTLAPGETLRRVFREPVAAIGAGPLRAELALRDDLAADNVAYAFLAAPPAISVELVADTPDFFLVRALEAHPNVTWKWTRAADYQPGVEGVVPVFLNWAPITVVPPPATPSLPGRGQGEGLAPSEASNRAPHPHPLPEGERGMAPPGAGGPHPQRPAAAIYVNPPPGRSPVAVAVTLDRALITEVDERHPVTRQVALVATEVDRALAFRAEQGDAVLARSVEHPLVVARGQGTERLLVIGFEPAGSDLPLRVAFPVLIANALNWVRGEAAAAERSFPVGLPVSVPVPSGVEEAGAVFLSASRGPVKAPVTVHEGSAHLMPRAAGFYHLSADGFNQTVVVNTVDARECDLAAATPAPAASPPAAAQEAHPMAGVPQGRAGAGLWPALLWAALALAAVEWVTYQRRWTV